MLTVGRLRKRDKLHYRYPGAGGEGYLDIINRLRAVIVEVERMTDHVILVGHRSVARVLLAYFKGLKREDVAELDVPLGILFLLEPVTFLSNFPLTSKLTRNRNHMAWSSKPIDITPKLSGFIWCQTTSYGELHIKRHIKEEKMIDGRTMSCITHCKRGVSES